MKKPPAARFRELQRDTLALYFAARHPGTPLLAKLIAVAVAAYAVSPIDLIPDFIPVIGYLDDAVILPAGIWLSLRLIPDEVWADCRAKADAMTDGLKRKSWTAAAIVLAIWLTGLAFLYAVAVKLLR